ncbi:MAG: CGNR zinc finger domain-containing protein [Clostridia bacterium]|nr:CGNR zinc finger domain-containing protein [Clostridia bacterium]
MERKICLIGSFATDWIKYSDYEYKNDSEGNLYIKPKEDAVFSMYNPFNVAEDIIIDFLKVGDASRRYYKNKSQKDYEYVKKLVLLFVKKYGLLGLISASTYNQNILGDKEVLIIEKNYIDRKEKTMDSEAYIKLFTPFAESDDLRMRYYKNSIDLVKAEDSPKFYGKRPLVMDLIFSKFYTERLEWIMKFARMLSEHFSQLLVYRASADHLTEQVTILANTFKANKIGFTINQLDKTIISWDFDSLKTAIETIYAFAVTDENILLSRCEHCEDFYIALSNREKYCSPVCRNRSNVQKSRRRRSETEEQQEG